MTAVLDARVSFRQPVTTDGFVDAGWWPRSTDLVEELTPLLDVLWTAGREIVRVGYNLDAWQPAPRRVVIGGRRVKLGGFRMDDPLLVTLTDLWGRERIDVLVVPPDTDPDVAERAMDLASRAGGTDHADRIMQLAASPQ